MTDSVTKEFVCPECAEAGEERSFTRPENLATHREKFHGVERPRRPRNNDAQPGTRGGPKLQRDLAKAQLGVSILVVTATNPGALGINGAMDLLQKNSEEWAGAVYAVARQDPRIMRTIESAMKAGVWAAFMAQTAGSVLTVAAMTGKVAVPYGAAVFLVPELATMMQQAPPPAEQSSGDGPAT